MSDNLLDWIHSQTGHARPAPELSSGVRDLIARKGDHEAAATLDVSLSVARQISAGQPTPIRTLDRVRGALAEQAEAEKAAAKRTSASR